MRTQYLAVIGLLLLGLSVWFWAGDRQSSLQQGGKLNVAEGVTTDADGTAGSVESVRQGQEKPTENAPEKTAESDRLQAESMDNFLRQFEHRRYSEDVQIEFVSVYVEYLPCSEDYKRLFSYNQQYDKNYLTNTLDDITQKHCDSMDRQYPVLSSRDGDMEKIVRQIMESDNANMFSMMSSVLGSMFNKEGDTHFVETAREINRQRNGQLLASFALMTELIQPQLPFEQNVLGGLDTDYLREIRALALVKQSCEYQQGGSCAAYSHYMVSKCWENPAICGLDFQQWYQQSTTTAIRADVELLLQAYLE